MCVYIHVYLHNYNIKQCHFIEPQNHRKDKVGREHSGSSGPTSLLYKIIPENVKQDGVQLVLEYLQ